MLATTQLDGQVALVTGGSRGIGFAAARGLGERGATVVLVGRDEPRVQAAAAELQQMDIDAVGFACDVSDAQDVADLSHRLGPLAAVDICVLSAGVMAERMSKTVRTTPEEWRRVMGTNLDGAFYVIQAFAPGMVERRHGRIITVSACLGRFTGPGLLGGLAPYRVSKTGVNALTRNLAAELQFGKRGVLVDAMCPNHCRTDMGGPDAPRSADEGADTILWLATRPATGETGLLWEDRQVVPW
jgi:3-oxoacyl-[acyl-carrier protein] reductase